MPPITGPGECTATDVVNVSAVVLPDNHRVVFSPVVTLQCSMAAVVAPIQRGSIEHRFNGCSRFAEDISNIHYIEIINRLLGLRLTVSEERPFNRSLF